MKSERRIVLSIAWVVVGAVLIGLGLAEVIDAFWTGMGSGLLVVGILQIIRFNRYYKSEEYREKVDTEIGDERNAFIRSKAWAWTGYLLVLILAVSSVVLRIAGQEVLSTAASFVVCLILILYWGSYLILNKKY